MAGQADKKSGQRRGVVFSRCCSFLESMAGLETAPPPLATVHCVACDRKRTLLTDLRDLSLLLFVDED